MEVELHTIHRLSQSRIRPLLGATTLRHYAKWAFSVIVKTDADCLQLAIIVRVRHLLSMTRLQALHTSWAATRSRKLSRVKISSNTSGFSADTADSDMESVGAVGGTEICWRLNS